MTAALALWDDTAPDPGEALEIALAGLETLADLDQLADGMTLATGDAGRDEVLIVLKNESEAWAASDARHAENMAILRRLTGEARRARLDREAWRAAQGASPA